jgi:L-arabinose isomerase
LDSRIKKLPRLLERRINDWVFDGCCHATSVAMRSQVRSIYQITVWRAIETASIVLPIYYLIETKEKEIAEALAVLRRPASDFTS